MVSDVVPKSDTSLRKLRGLKNFGGGACAISTLVTRSVTTPLSYVTTVKGKSTPRTLR